MTDPTKKVNNPLFNASVTGGTFEEFSQNAVLMPAQEKPPPPVLNISQDEILNQALNNQPILQEQFEPFQNQQPQFIQPPPPIREVDLNPQQPTHFSSVFSSFSNILKITSTNTNKVIEENIPVAPPAGIAELIDQDNANAEPIPLFPASGNFTTPAVTTAAPPPSNTFRRAGLKRPAYAQVPGLSSSTAPPPVLSTPQNLPPLPVAPDPIQFAAPTFPFQQSVASYQPPTPTFFNTHPLTTPVMSAISASELLEASHLNVHTDSTSNPNNNYVTDNENFLVNTQTTNLVYRPVYNHWFFKKEVEGKTLWKPFSMIDSLALEQAYISSDLDPDKVIPTDGGRYDVNILRRQRIPVYWKGEPSEVRRCSWFHKGKSDGRYEPYEENVATMLEDEYKTAFELNQWHKKVQLNNGETVEFHAPDILVLFPPTQSPDSWGNQPNQLRPRIVKRGMDEFDIDEGEPIKVDHLLFMVHGIGSVCDLKFRSVEEVVDEFRSISLQLVQSHYHSSCEKGIANRVEVLPISWHDKLHSEDTGIDKKLKSITLESIPRLRDFTNDTLLDILFYTSPIYCQTIISTVGNELNRIYDLFKQRNPSFSGGVSLGGHSLGSLILFDLLSHQHPEPEPEPEPNAPVNVTDEDVVPPLQCTKPPPLQRKINRRISYMMGNVGTGQPQIMYPHLSFQPETFFALGSPIGMFVTIRGLDALGDQFSLPTCPAFFNIFHPYDPVAYRVESLVNPELAQLKPVLIPHHKGRKRMHLELKETMARVGADLKQRVVDSMKTTWNFMFQRQNPPSLEEEVNKAFAEQLAEPDASEELQPEPTDLPLGQLNKGRRVDYVLQEAPFEFFNEYIFALTSHVCYWESEDTMLLILKEIYNSMNIATDNQIPQQSMTIERPPPSPRSARAAAALNFNQNYALLNNGAGGGMNPTNPIQQNVNIGPPPTGGFVRKT